MSGEPQTARPESAKGKSDFPSDPFLHWRRVVWQALAFATVYVALVLIVAERRLFEDAVLTWGSQMPIVAVLREDVGDAQANAFAQKLQKEVKGVQCSVIGRREARSLLALQEPWLQQLPETLIGDLPLVIELRHPALFRSAQEFDAFLGYLQSQREVEFVIFNSVGQDQVFDALSNVRRHMNVLMGVVAGALLVLFALLHHHIARKCPVSSVPRLFISAILSSGAGMVIGCAAAWAIAHFILKNSASLISMLFPAGVLLTAMLLGLVLLLELLHLGATTEGGCD